MPETDRHAAHVHPSSGREPGIDEARRLVHLAGLVASRLCHDLISPLGAIGNGVELLQHTFPKWHAV